MSAPQTLKLLPQTYNPAYVPAFDRESIALTTSL